MKGAGMIVCADDYGISPGVNQAVVQLVGAGRVTAVSVMAALERVDRQALEPLLKYAGCVDIGLHLTLTREDAGPAGASLPSFRGLLVKGWLGMLREEELIQNIRGQYDLFVRKTGRAPDFLDGHMHVHQFPGVREALIRFVAGLPEPKPYVRNTYMPLEKISGQGISPLKTWLISIPGGKMKRALEQAGVRTNDGFAGIYDFAQYGNYPEYLKKFLGPEAGPQTIMMCHPGSEEPWRAAEQ